MDLPARRRARVPGDRGVRRPDRPRRDGDDARRRRRRPGRDQRHHADRHRLGGGVAGDCASYLLGQRLGRDFLVRHGPRFQITPERLEQVEAFFANHGGKAIFIGRFVGIVRAVAPFLAGRAACRSGGSCPYDVLGAGLWATTFIMIGYVFWQSFGPGPEDRQGGRARASGSRSRWSSGSSWLVRWLRVAENRALLEQRRRSRRSTAPVLRVLRPVVRWARGPLRFFIGRLTPGQLGLELTTLLAIAAVGSFAYFGYWILLAGARGRRLRQARQPTSRSDLYNAAAVDIAEVLTVFGLTVADGDRCARSSTLVLLAAPPRSSRRRSSGSACCLTVACVQIAKHARRPPAPVRRARRRGGLGLPVRTRRVRDGVDRAGRRRGAARAGAARALVGRRRRDRRSPRS